MLSMEIRSLVGTLVNQLLVKDNNRQAGRALHFHFDCRMDSYTNEKSYHSSCALHLLYYLRPDMTYVSVFSAVLPSPFDCIGKVDHWEHECTHDSCWRDINVFSNTYFKMADEINSLRLRDDLPEVAPAAMSEHNSFQLFGSVFDWVGVEVKKDPNDDRSYRRIVKLT